MCKNASHVFLPDAREYCFMGDVAGAMCKQGGESLRGPEVGHPGGTRHCDLVQPVLLQEPAGGRKEKGRAIDGLKERHIDCIETDTDRDGEI